jgi:dUTP pyrophosphatase
VTDTPLLKVRLLYPDSCLPRRATPGSAGLDLYAWLPSVGVFRTAYELSTGERHLFQTGIAVEIPEGFEGQIRPRSGLALRLGLTVLNSPGTIDSDYRGEVKVLLVNLSNQRVTVPHRSAIAQLVIAPVVTPRVCVIQQLSATERGAGGFGSTGS